MPSEVLNQKLRWYLEFELQKNHLQLFAVFHRSLCEILPRLVTMDFFLRLIFHPVWLHIIVLCHLCWTLLNKVHFVCANDTLETQNYFSFLVLSTWGCQSNVQPHVHTHACTHFHTSAWLGIHWHSLWFSCVVAFWTALLHVSPLDPPDDVPLPCCLAHHVWRSAHPHADSPKGQSGGPHPETPWPAALLSEEDCSGDVLCYVVGRGSGWVQKQKCSLCAVKQTLMKQTKKVSACGKRHMRFKITSKAALFLI